MFWPGAKLLVLLLRGVLVVTLTVFLAIPETARARLNDTNDTIAGASKHDHSHPDKQARYAAEFIGHCHPGLDCFVTAILALQPVIQACDVEVRSALLSINHARESWLMSFDPPPPRV